MRELKEQHTEFAENGIGEILRVLRLCHPGFETSRGLTFSAGRKDPVADWNQWCGSLFLNGIAPALVATMEYAVKGHSREVCRVDMDQDRNLPGHERGKSRAAGELLLQGFTVPPGARVLQKFRALYESGKTPGHFPVVYGVRCALFNIPPRLAVLGYLYSEWQTGTRWSIAPRHMPDFASLFEDINAPVSLQDTPNPLFPAKLNA